MERSLGKLGLHVNVKLSPGTINTKGEWLGLMVCTGSQPAARVFVNRNADYALNKRNSVIGSFFSYHIFYFYL